MVVGSNTHRHTVEYLPKQPHFVVERRLNSVTLCAAFENQSVC